VLWLGPTGLAVSAIISGASVFMAPGTVTSFTRRNLLPEAWARTIGLFTVVLRSQGVVPCPAGLPGDAFGSIGTSLLAAAAVLGTGALQDAGG
jgi:hypothetical protein